MLKHIFHKNRVYIAVIFAIILYTVVHFFPYIEPALHPDAWYLHQLADDILAQEIQKDPLSYHLLFADDTDILKQTNTYTYKFPVYKSHEKDNEPARNSVSELKKRFARINTDRLSDQDILLYNYIRHYVDSQEKKLTFAYYEEPLSVSNGIQIQLPMLLTEYTFSNISDIEHYLSLLASTKDYLEGIALYETEKKAARLFMSDAAASQVVSELDSILPKNELNTFSNFLQTSFIEKMDELSASSLLSDKEKRTLQDKKEYYIAENNRLLSTVLQPAYESLGDTVLLLSDSGITDKGLCHTDNGQSYYQYLLQQNVGSNRTVESYREMILQQIHTDLNHMQELSTDYHTLSSSPENESTPVLANVLSDTQIVSQADTMLKNLSEQIEKDFPKIETISNCNVKTITNSLSSLSAPAFYCIPPINNYSRQTIYLNPYYQMTSLSLYTTLAHEGYPGHLFQTCYQRDQAKTQQYHPLISYLSTQYTGYIEGWATYVEYLSYDYAAQYFTNYQKLISYQKSSVNSLYCQLARTEHRLNLCLMTLLDFAIHYDGITKEECADMLFSFGIQNQETAYEIYYDIVRNPAVYPSYCLGYLEICDLQKQAQQNWGSDYSPYKFHAFLLSFPPVDYSFIEESLHTNHHSGA